jgi:hypothetical protein
VRFFGLYYSTGSGWNAALSSRLAAGDTRALEQLRDMLLLLDALTSREVDEMGVLDALFAFLLPGGALRVGVGMGMGVGVGVGVGVCCVYINRNRYRERESREREKICMCVYTYIPTYIQTYKHTCMHAFMHAYIHTSRCGSGRPARCAVLEDNESRPLW